MCVIADKLIIALRQMTPHISHYYNTADWQPSVDCAFSSYGSSHADKTMHLISLSMTALVFLSSLHVSLFIRVACTPAVITVIIIYVVNAKSYLTNPSHTA